MSEVIYKMVYFDGAWFYQRISDGKLIKRIYLL